MWRRFLMKMPCLFEDQKIVQISPFLLSAIVVQIGDDNVSISLSFEMVLIQAEQTIKCGQKPGAKWNLTEVMSLTLETKKHIFPFHFPS
jgi:hypothetical protein